MKSQLRFIDYIVEKVEFYNNFNDNEDVDLDFDISSEIELSGDEDNIFLTRLNIEIFRDAKKNGYPFSMNLTISGIFEFENIDEEMKKSFMEVNSVAILFPYARAIVSSYTANSNVTPLILPAINVVNYIRNKK